jgi:uncharacterized membrane protein
MFPNGGMNMTSARLPSKTVSRNRLFDDEVGLERLVFFSDAVFAIAITLLALEIHLPVEATGLSDLQLMKSLVEIWPKYLSFMISFLVIGNFWISHHRRFRAITRYDTRLLFLNLLMLMCIAFIPFPTSILSENSNRTATIFYALTIAVTGFLSTILWRHASRENRLTIKSFDRKTAYRYLLSSLMIPVVFLLSIGLAFINPDLARYSWVLTAPIALRTR